MATINLISPTQAHFEVTKEKNEAFLKIIFPKPLSPPGSNDFPISSVQIKLTPELSDKIVSCFAEIEQKNS